MTRPDEADQFAALTAELHAEADRLRRADGELAALESDIVAAFRDLAPAGALDDDAPSLIQRLEAAGQIDADVPTESQRAPLTPVKTGLRKLYYWYVRYVADQVTVANSLTARILTDHEVRLRRLGDEVDLAGLGVDPSPPLADDLVVSVAAAAAGRTLHAWCGDGELVRALDAAGLDSYGIDPDHGRLGAGLRDGLDLRPDDPVVHLHRLPENGLGTVVLGRAIDAAPVGRIVEAVDAAMRATTTGGRVVVLADVGDVDPVRFELLGRAPLSEEAWHRLLTARGLADVSVDSGADGVRVASGTC